MIQKKMLVVAVFANFFLLVSCKNLSKKTDFSSDVRVSKAGASYGDLSSSFACRVSESFSLKILNYFKTKKNVHYLFLNTQSTSDSRLPACSASMESFLGGYLDKNSLDLKIERLGPVSGANGPTPCHLILYDGGREVSRSFWAGPEGPRKEGEIWNSMNPNHSYCIISNS